jgi:hypothetical protein
MSTEYTGGGYECYSPPNERPSKRKIETCSNAGEREIKKVKRDSEIVEVGRCDELQTFYYVISRKARLYTIKLKTELTRLIRDSRNKLFCIELRTCDSIAMDFLCRFIIDLSKHPFYNFTNYAFGVVNDHCDPISHETFMQFKKNQDLFNIDVVEPFGKEKNRLEVSSINNIIDFYAKYDKMVANETEKRNWFVFELGKIINKGKLDQYIPKCLFD